MNRIFGSEFFFHFVESIKPGKFELKRFLSGPTHDQKRETVTSHAVGFGLNLNLRILRIGAGYERLSKIGLTFGRQVREQIFNIADDVLMQLSKKLSDVGRKRCDLIFDDR